MKTLKYWLFLQSFWTLGMDFEEMLQIGLGKICVALARHDLFPMFLVPAIDFFFHA